MNQAELSAAGSTGFKGEADDEGWYLCPRCPRCLSIGGQWRGVRMRKKRGPVHRRCCTRCTQWFYAELETEGPLVLGAEEEWG